MNAPQLTLACCLFLALAGTVASAQTPVAELARPPFTADEIRSATSVGRSYTHHVKSVSGTSSFRKTAFTAVTPTGCVIEASSWKEGKEPSDVYRSTATWVELQEQGSFPEKTTTIHEAELTLASGTFACLRYDEVDGSGAIKKRTWFALEMPGPAVLIQYMKDGNLALSITLVEFEL